MVWEVDWSKQMRRGRSRIVVWAKDPDSKCPQAREWHWVERGNLLRHGIVGPIAMAGAPGGKKRESPEWEFDWGKTKTELRGHHRHQYVWARSVNHKWARHRDWHWLTYGTVKNSGAEWAPIKRGNHSVSGLRSGKADARGYVRRGPMSMTEEERKLADDLGLWVEGRANGRWSYKAVPEHRLIAAKKYGAAVIGKVVRHLNGDKGDNRPENLVLGTPKENQMDHQTARLEAMKWRERAEKAEAENAKLKRKLAMSNWWVFEADGFDPDKMVYERLSPTTSVMRMQDQEMQCPK